MGQFRLMSWCCYISLFICKFCSVVHIRVWTTSHLVLSTHIYFPHWHETSIWKPQWSNKMSKNLFWRFRIVEEQDDFRVGEDVNENKLILEEAMPTAMIFALLKKISSIAKPLLPHHWISVIELLEFSFCWKTNKSSEFEDLSYLLIR